MVTVRLSLSKQFSHEAKNTISPLWIAKNLDRSDGSKFRSASTDRPASAHTGLADVACDVCDQAWHCQPGEVPLPRVMLCSLRGRARETTVMGAGGARNGARGR
jgi:hypothetical protein